MGSRKGSAGGASADSTRRATGQRIEGRVKAFLPFDAYEVVATRSYRDEKSRNAVI